MFAMIVSGCEMVGRCILLWFVTKSSAKLYSPHAVSHLGYVILPTIFVIVRLDERTGNILTGPGTGFTLHICLSFYN
jgi:hypothetical protein